MQYFKKKAPQPMFPWHHEIDMRLVSMSGFDLDNGSPKEGDMIAVNPSDPEDMWLVSAEYVAEHYEQVEAPDS